MRLFIELIITLYLGVLSLLIRGIGRIDIAVRKMKRGRL